MHTSEGKISVLQYLLPAVQRISDRLERMAVANDVAGYIGVEQGMVLDTFLRSAAGRQAKPGRAAQERDPRPMNAGC